MINMKSRRFLITTVAAIATLSPVLGAGAEELTGTRPGPEGQPLEMEATLFLLDLSKIDGADQSFTADVFLLLRWRDERLIADVNGARRLKVDEVWNPRVQIINQRRVWTTFPEVVDIQPDGMVTYRQRFYGHFAAPLNLRDFPLDRHSFPIRLVTPGYGAEDIRLVQSAEMWGEGRSPILSIPDWSVGAFQTRVEPWEITPGSRSLASFVGVFEARRHIGYWVGQAFFSVAIIVFMSWVVFWIDPRHVGPRISVAVTSMLTLIAYRFLLGQLLPPVSYLTRLDHFLLGSTLLVFTTLIQVAVTSALSGEDHLERAASLNRASRWALPTAYVLLVVVAAWVI